MEVHSDEWDSLGLRTAVFYNAYRKTGGSLTYVAKCALKDHPYHRWIILDTSPGDYRIRVYTTIEVQALYVSYRDGGGKPSMADPVSVRQFLVMAGVYRMKVREGCTGCWRFWGRSGSEGQCRKCKRCLECCNRDTVEGSCVSKLGKGK